MILEGGIGDGCIFPKQAAIFKEKLVAGGAEVRSMSQISAARHPPAATTLQTLTHIVCGLHFFQILDRLLVSDIPDTVKILRPTWLSACIKTWSIVPEDSHAVSRLEQCLQPGLQSEPAMCASPHPRKMQRRMPSKRGGPADSASDSSEQNRATDSASSPVPPPAIQQRPWQKEESFLPADLRLARCPNAELVLELEAIKDCYEAIQDQYHVLGYRRAIGAIERLSAKIVDARQVRDIDGIGEKILVKIAEFLATGRIQKRHEMETQELVVGMRELTKCLGVGPAVAYRWWNGGWRSIQEVRQKINLANCGYEIRLGLELYEDLAQRIPRQEVYEVLCAAQPLAARLFPQVFMEVAGSFRRGAATCGDIDFILTERRPAACAFIADRIVHDVVAAMKASGLLTHDCRKGGARVGDRTYMGICRLRADLPHRRVDLKFFRYEEYGAAMLYFTGSDYLNRKMRLLASHHGLLLNERGLFQRNGPPGAGDGPVAGSRFALLTEADYFHKLDIPYLLPQERSV